MNPDANSPLRPAGGHATAGDRGALSRAGMAALALLVIAGAGALAASCARQSGARADSREVRLTRDEAYKGRPLFSPDGKTVAFAQRPGTGDGMLGVYVMPVGGGTIERISPDTLGLTPLRWASDGQGIFCVNVDRKRLYRLGLDGTVRFVEAAEPLSRFADVTGDGASYLLLAFHKDNYDVILRRAGGRAEILASTPEWEQDAVFGPGPDQATTLSTPTFQSSQTTITLRSLSSGDAKPLPLPEGQKYSPAWSPDGRTLAYAVSSNGQLDLWLYDVTTARATPAIQDPQDTSGPAWSSDGKWLAFARATRSSRLFVGEPGDPDRRQLTQGPANDYSPSSSPDGKWIAFQRRPPPGTAGADTPSLCVMPAAGGDVIQLDLGGLSLPGKGSDLAWSWDSEHIAFSAREATTSLDIYRIRRDGTGLLRVTIEAGDEIDPRWSPDGRRIAYTRVGGGQTQVAVLPSSGGASRVISDEGVVSEGVAWSPDGSQLAYLSLRREGAYDLWVVPAAGDRPKRLVLSHTTLPWPHRWSEDGRHLILMRGQGSDWYVTEFDPDSGEERRVADEVMLPSGLGSYLRFHPDGEAHRRLLCPAGAVMADGEQKVDLHMVRSGDLLKSRLISSDGRGLHWFARTGWVASF